MSLCSNWYLGISPQIFQAWLLMEKETLVYITCSHQYWKQRHSSQSEATYFGENIIQAILLLSEWSKLKYTSVLRAGTISSRPPSGYQLLCLRCWADAAFGAKKEPAELADPPYPSTQGKELGLQIWASLQNSDFQPFADPKPHELLNWAGEMASMNSWLFTPHINKHPKFSLINPVCICTTSIKISQRLQNQKRYFWLAQVMPIHPQGHCQPPVPSPLAALHILKPAQLDLLRTN